MIVDVLALPTPPWLVAGWFDCPWCLRTLRQLTYDRDYNGWRCDACERVFLFARQEWRASA